MFALARLQCFEVLVKSVRPSNKCSWCLLEVSWSFVETLWSHIKNQLWYCTKIAVRASLELCTRPTLVKKKKKKRMKKRRSKKASIHNQDKNRAPNGRNSQTRNRVGVTKWTNNIRKNKHRLKWNFTLWRGQKQVTNLRNSSDKHRDKSPNGHTWNKKPTTDYKPRPKPSPTLKTKNRSPSRQTRRRKPKTRPKPFSTLTAKSGSPSKNHPLTSMSSL